MASTWWHYGGSPSSSQSSSVSRADIQVVDGSASPVTVDPFLLYMWRNICCCWFDTSQEGVGQYDLDRSFWVHLGHFEEGFFEVRLLAKANGVYLYGVAARTSLGADVAMLTHRFGKVAPWVKFVFPIGKEDGEEFFTRIRGVMRRSEVESLDGVSVKQLLGSK